MKHSNKASARTLLFFLAWTLLSPLAYAQADETGNSASAQSADGGEQGDQEDRDESEDQLVLPEMVVDLEDPQYDDLELMLLNQGQDSGALGILPELGTLSGQTDPELIDQAPVPSSNQEADVSPVPHWDVLLGLSLPLWGRADASLYWPLDETGRRELQIDTENSYRSSIASGGALAGVADSSAQHHALGLTYRRPGAQFAAQAQLFRQGLQGLADSSAQDDEIRLTEIATSFDVAYPSDPSSRWQLFGGLGADWVRRRGAAAAGQSDYAWDVILLQPYLGGAFSPGDSLSLGLSGEYLAGIEAREGVVHAVDGELRLDVTPPGLFSAQAAWNPGLYAGHLALADFSVQTRFSPAASWELSLEGGLKTESLGLWEISQDVPLYGISYAQADGLFERFWETGANGLVQLSPALRLEAGAQLRYYLRGVELPAWDSGGFLNYGSGWNTSARAQLAWYLSDPNRLSVLLLGTLPGDHVGFEKNALSVDISHSGERLYWSAGAELSLDAHDDGLQYLPILQASAVVEVNHQLSLEASLYDPLAFALEQGRKSGRDHMHPLSLSGFRAEFVTRLQF